METTMFCITEDSEKLWEQAKMFPATSKNSKFRAEEAILVFEFLTRVVQKADTRVVFEPYIVLKLLKLLRRRAERHVGLLAIVHDLAASHDGQRSSTISFAVIRLQRLSKTLLMIYVISLNTLKMDKITCSERINDTTHRCGKVFDEIKKMTFFRNRLLPSIQTIVDQFRESKGRRELSCKESIQ